ncbi:MAG: AGE family epimerase/isomerase [Alphaproteobacteria bacterium]
MSQIAASRCEALAAECDREFEAILDWWSTHAVDPRGGFYGEIGADNAPNLAAGKGAVLNARLLWFFSLAASHLNSERARVLADRAVDYIRTAFLDQRCGGLFWEVDASGRPANPRKQAYAQAFAIYGLCEHYRATETSASRDLALALFDLLETRFAEPRHGGYIEARSEDWSPLADMRLSDVDANTPKSQNTHLHILEAYTSLVAIARPPRTEDALYRCIRIFETRLLNPKTNHLRLFTDLDWTDRSEAVSFGHDIEASWLLWRAGEVLTEAEREQLFPLVIDLARTALREAVDDEGALRSERSFNGHIDGRRVWWAQAEAMVGFLNAYERTGEAAFFDAFERAWLFIQHHHKAANGEWTWWSDIDAPNADRAYKAGFWKCPYHNGRAMLEVSQRLRRMAQQR